MNFAFPLGDTLRDNLIRVFCLISLSFILYFFYLDWKYKNYIEIYRNTQREEEQTINKKFKSTIVGLRTLTEAIGKRVVSAPENYRNIQAILKAGISFSQKDNIPTIQDATYYKLSDPKAMITPSIISPLHAHAHRKPLKNIASITTQNNAMVGTIPILDNDNHLKGILEIKVPFLDIQKFIGVDKVTTLEFPQLFDTMGKQIIRTDPLDFSLKTPLSYSEYIKSHESYFWVLFYAVSMGSILLFLSGILVKKRISLVFGTQIGQLNKELNSLSTYNSLQHHMIQQFRELTGVIHKSMDRVRQSYSGFPLNASEKQTLIKAATELAENLSSGVWSNHQRETLSMKTVLDQIIIHFSEQIQKLDIKLQLTCPHGLTFVGDPLFVKLVLLNVMGYPLFSIPRHGEISVVVIEENGFIHIKIRDNRYSLTEVGRQYLKIPFEFFVESHKLQQICLQNGVGYKSSKTTKGKFHTKLSFPLDPDHIYKGNVIPLPR